MKKPILNLHLSCRSFNVSSENGWQTIDLMDVDPDSIYGLELVIVIEEMIEERAREIVESKEEADMKRRHRHD